MIAKLGWLKTPFLVDSAADVSVISLKCVATGNNPTNGFIAGIGGRQPAGVPTSYKIRFSSDSDDVSYDIHLRYLDLQQEMVILGQDFLSRFGVTTFDWRSNRIQLGDKWVYIADFVNKKPDWGPVDINRSLAAKMQQELQHVLSQNADVFAYDPKAPRECSVASHTIQSKDNRVCFSKVKRIPNKWKQDVDRQVDEMVKNDIIRQSKSSYNSNPLLVDKKDKTKRFVIDFRNLNETTVPDSYPLPNVDDLIDQCYGCNFFSQLDLASGYWGVPIVENDKHKTAFSIPRGKFEFNRMPFGLKNAQATFQRCMDGIVEQVKALGDNYL